ncbi:unnamed protein product, partial [Amoebophrya sp. A120]
AQEEGPPQLHQQITKVVPATTTSSSPKKSRGGGEQGLLHIPAANTHSVSNSTTAGLTTLVNHGAMTGVVENAGSRDSHVSGRSNMTSGNAGRA